MKDQQFLRCALLTLVSFFVIYQTSLSQTAPRKFYKYDVIATTSSSLDVYAAPSINDFGDVAFAGRKTPGGGTVFLSRLGQPIEDMMTSLSTSPQQFVAGKVQINDSRQIIEHTFLSGTTPPQNYLRLVNDVNNFTLIAAANGAGTFNDFNLIWPNSISINNLGDPVFVTNDGSNSTILTTGIRPNFFTLQFPSGGDYLRPMVSDSGDIVLRAGPNQTDPIKFYPYELDDSLMIASGADGFTSLGQSPGISDFNEVIVFYGDLDVVGAAALGTNPGPGIFASILIDDKTGERKIVRIAGRLIENISAAGGNDDGYCDVGETCIQGELGFDMAGNPIYFNSFDVASRVAVAHQSAGAPGIEDDVFVVSFIATPNIASDRPERPFTSQVGLWTITTQIKNENGVLREKPGVPITVLQIGEVIDSQIITAINVYDPIASVKTVTSVITPADHRIALHATTNTGNLIVRAERNAETPIIFIPGITGSRLVEISGGTQTERWPGVGAGLLTGSNLDTLRPSQNANLIATDVVREILNINGVLLGKIYEPVLEALTSRGGLREYQVEDNTARRTYEGCDMEQRFQVPKLFVFAYDWRKSNSESSLELDSYIRCVQRFYPGTKVDIVAHSMGGLIARSYILNFPTTHNVRKLITVASPFLGAPRALDTIETGRTRASFLPDFLDKRVFTNKIKNIALESQAIHELFPSEAYFTLGGRPLLEETYDFNFDGVVPQALNYPQTFEFYNSRFSTDPYWTNQNFHGVVGQDDWRFDTSDVEYFHLYGLRSIRDTVLSITAKPIIKHPLSISRLDYELSPNFDFGDRTVPLLSAERIGNSLDFNSPDATLRGYPSNNLIDDGRFEHTGLIKDDEVINQILAYLDLTYEPTIYNLSREKGDEEMTSFEFKAHTGTSLSQMGFPMREAYYVKISGTEKLDITDGNGNTNADIGDDGFELAVPGVSYAGGIYDGPPDSGFHGLVMPAEEGEFIIKFRTGTNSLGIEVLRGIGNTSPSMAIRYIDVDLPANVECLLQFSPAGVPDLAYDSDGDGIYETVVPADVRVTGAAAQDVTAPTVSMTFGRGRRLTISATDTESGVATIYYRINGAGSFSVYQHPFVLPTLANFVEAFADDNVGNRSSPIRGDRPPED